MSLALITNNFQKNLIHKQCVTVNGEIIIHTGH